VKIRRTFTAMGGIFDFMCFPQKGISEKDVLDSFERSIEEVWRVENKFTDFKESEFNQINVCAGLKPCKVDDEVMNLILETIEFSKKSNGVFDISFASIGHPWRMAKSIGRVLSEEDRENLSPLINYRNIEIDQENNTVFLPDKRMRIGMGGVGKGYAVDQAFNILKKSGLSNFYINGSGDIRVHAHLEAPRPWKIGIRNPFAREGGKSMGLVQLRNGAVATSGSYIHQVSNPDKKLDHHIIRPESGRSSSEIVSATVVADTCLEADVTGTILMNLNKNAAVSYMNDGNIVGFFVDNHGRSFLSRKAILLFGLVE